jgi:hypothetical protein
MRQHGGQIDDAGRLVDGRRLHRGDLVLAQRLAHDIEAAGERSIAEAALAVPCASAAERSGQGLLWVDELGLGLGQGRGQGGDRLTGPGMGSLRRHDVKADRAEFRALPAHAMPDRLLGILRHQRLELAFRPLVVEEGLPGIAEEGRELGPRIRRAHVNDADRLDAQLSRGREGGGSTLTLC